MESKKVTPKDAAAWLARRLKADENRPTAQARGAFSKGPRAYVDCRPCTRLFERPVGVPKQRARSHAAAHRLGLVRKPEEAAA